MVFALPSFGAEPRSLGDAEEMTKAHFLSRFTGGHAHILEARGPASGHPLSENLESSMLPVPAEQPGLSVFSGSVSHRKACLRTGRDFRALPDTGQFRSFAREWAREVGMCVGRRKPRLSLTYRPARGRSQRQQINRFAEDLLHSLQVMLCARWNKCFRRRRSYENSRGRTHSYRCPGCSSIFCGACNELALRRIYNPDRYLQRWHAWQRVGSRADGCPRVGLALFVTPEFLTKRQITTESTSRRQPRSVRHHLAHLAHVHRHPGWAGNVWLV